MIAFQIVLLSVGFALTYSWDAELQPKVLTMAILTIVILLYPMPDRLNDSLRDKFVELQRDLKVTQIILMEMRDRLGVKEQWEDLSGSEVVEKTEALVKELESAHQEFSDSFEKAREGSGAFLVDFLEYSVGALVYIGGVLGVAAVLGWAATLAI